MFKNRSFVAGLGAGIIAGAILLQIMQIGDDSQQKLSDGYKDVEPKLYTQAELDDRIAEERAKAADVDAVESAKPSENPTDEAAATPAAEDKDTKAEEQATVTEKAETKRKIHITGGMNLTDTAELLKEQNLITDKSAFIAKMKKKPVRAGYFLFEGNPTVDEVIQIITSQPVSKEEFDQQK
ncbi:endolytic transglycosylase MltG [Paenibacillus lupini]|uniref:endolytic transglycosylase MltG n=1 Tax=Paenibacillus lupini TaxID=1450204 RepID=UPI00141E2466|nr:endolytic transglycosylase MltG [Paenibacillus lupini]NIK25403.1 hypothetical protein [Paenibacillus lupini]